jgi:hypothetical protein
MRLWGLGCTKLLIDRSAVLKEYIRITSLGVGMVFAEKIPALSELAQLGVGMLFLRFSRDNER